MNFEFSIEELNVIMAALGRMPYDQVFQLVDNIREQATPQLKAAQEASQAKAAQSAGTATKQ